MGFTIWITQIVVKNRMSLHTINQTLHAAGVGEHHVGVILAEVVAIEVDEEEAGAEVMTRILTHLGRETAKAKTTLPHHHLLITSVNEMRVTTKETNKIGEPDHNWDNVTIVVVQNIMSDFVPNVAKAKVATADAVEVGVSTLID